eukprot:571090-Pyramimonas_sp.AAC.1
MGPLRVLPCPPAQPRRAPILSWADESIVESGGRASDGGGPWPAMGGGHGANADHADKNENGEVQGYYVH